MDNGLRFVMRAENRTHPSKNLGESALKTFAANRSIDSGSERSSVFTAVVRHNSNHRLEEIRQSLARSGKSAKERLKFAFELWTVRPFDTIVGSEEAEGAFGLRFRIRARDHGTELRLIPGSHHPDLAAAGQRLGDKESFGKADCSYPHQFGSRLRARQQKFSPTARND